MKKRDWVLIALAIAAIAVTAIFSLMLPEQVPMAVSKAGEAERMGGKLRFLLYPAAAAVICAAFVVLMHKACEDGSSLQKILFWAGLAILLGINVISFVNQHRALYFDPDASAQVVIDDAQTLAVGLGILIILIGSFMPRTKRKSIFGLRTSWSISDDVVWLKSQKFGAAAFACAGTLTLIFTFFLPGKTVTILSLMMLVIASVISSDASRRYYEGEW